MRTAAGETPPEVRPSRNCWFDDTIFDNRYEAAIRSWGQQAPEIAIELPDADTKRIAMFERFDYAPLVAQVRARTMYLTQLGYVSMKTTEPLNDRTPAAV